jgi:serine/threonine protein kinase
MVEGQLLGSYRLVGLLGEGGMGEVWQGRHQHLTRPAAVKVIRPEALGASGGTEAEKLLLRFEREADATASLRSPHTVQLYDFGTANGTFFYAMELLTGCSLESLISRHGPICEERAIWILQAACKSLEEAHRTGVIHRDLKPSNLFLCKLGLHHDFVKVLDFGLVKYMDQPDAVKLTNEDTAQGTPAYIPPEVVRGSAGFDARSDIYSLGCVAYWLLTGALVFESDNSIAIVMSHVNDAPVPLSQRTDLPVSSALEDLVMRCLAKDPDERPQSAALLDAELGAIAVDKPWSEERAEVWWKEYRPEEWEQPAGHRSAATLNPGTATPPGQPGFVGSLIGAVVMFVVASLAVLAVIQTRGRNQAEAPSDIAPTVAPIREPEKPARVIPDPAELVPPPEPMATFTVTASGSARLWRPVVDQLVEPVSWVEPDAQADWRLVYAASTSGRGSETWTACRSVAYEDGTQICAKECVSREYTFATMQDVERWQSGFVNSLNDACVQEILASLLQRSTEVKP